jgi:glycosyltransferase involved in cell wall biosynthesis
MPLVSVVVPTFNRAHTIVRCVQSVVAQTLQDFELLIVDDGSTDDTAQILGDIHDPRLRLIRNVHTKGPSGARNTGVESATGKYVAFLDSDDEWLPEKLERQVNVMESLPRDWCGVYSGVRVVKNGNTKRPITYLGGPSGDVFKEYLLLKFSMPTPTLLFRRCCLEALGPSDESMDRMEDVEWNLRLLRQWKMACVPEPLAVLHSNCRKRCATVYDGCLDSLTRRFQEDARLLGPETERAFMANLLFERAVMFLRERQYRKSLSYLWRSARRKTPSPIRCARLVYGFVRSVWAPNNQPG